MFIFSYIIITLLIPVAIGAIVGGLQAGRLKRLVAERALTQDHVSDDLIDYRCYDPTVVQAVCDALKNHLRSVSPSFPIRPHDDLVSVFGMDPEDVEDFVSEIAERCGRRLPTKTHKILIIRPTVSGVIELICNGDKKVNIDKMCECGDDL